MSHTIIVRPTSDFTPHVTGVVQHVFEIADGVTIQTESTEYLRRVAAAVNARLALADEPQQSERVMRIDPERACPTCASKGITERPELQHPGTWLPGDRISTARRTWEFNGERWPCISHPGSGGWLTTWDVDRYVGEGSDGSVRITHLVRRENGADR